MCEFSRKYVAFGLDIGVSCKGKVTVVSEKMTARRMGTDMTVWTEMSSSAKGAVAAVVVAVVAIAGWTLWGGPDKTPVSQAEQGTQAADATAAVQEPAAPAQAEPERALPTIDVLRVAPDGMTTLAGRTEAAAQVSILLDGAQIAAVAADGAGQFAAVFTLPPAEAPRFLTLTATLADGTVLAGAEGVAIAPFAAPEPAPEPTQVAAAEPAAQPEAEAVAPATIKVTEEGAQVLQPAEPVPADLAAQVSLDVISYTAEGAVQLGGRGTAGSSLHLYLDNSEVATTAVGADGAWSLTTSAIEPGVYTLRIDQMDAAGNVTSRLETPFKRETLEALAAAAQTAEPAVAVAATEVQDPMAVTPDPAQTVAAAEAVPQGAREDAAPAGTEAAGDQVAAAETAPEVPAQTVGDAAAPAAPEASPEVSVPETQAASEVAVAPAAEAPATEAAPAASAGPITVTVQPGFTLWAIAEESFGSGVMYVQVFEANKDKIRDPDLIYPGQVLSVPAAP